MLAVGLMSGTSLDGVDAVLVETDGESGFRPLKTHHLPYSREFQSRLRALLDDWSGWLCVEKELTLLHYECVKQLLNGRSDVQVIGFHGQTVYHRPAEGVTWQIGNAHLLAQLTGVDVVADFRRRDVACGGEGAPLVPVFHKCLCAKDEKPVAVVNIGGVANVTFISEQDELLAFDTGPGNALINDAMVKHFSQSYDESGRVASTGSVQQQLVDDMLENNEYFRKKAPKSLDRNDFLQSLPAFEHLKPEDLVATLTKLTVDSILLAIRSLPSRPRKVYVCGGGFHNDTIMKWLNSGNVSEFCGIDALNFDPDFVEAQAFAYLAVRYMKELPSSFPSTTRSCKDTLCGVLYKV